MRFLIARISILCVLGILAAFDRVATAQPGVRDLVRLDAGNPVEKEVRALLREWRREVLVKDVKKLVGRTWPEYRESVRHHLSRPNGQLYKMLYVGPHPLTELLRKVPEAGLVSFRHRMNDEVAYVVGCFASDTQMLANIESFAGLMKAVDNKRLFCLNLAYDPAGATWDIDYTFGGDL